jgi:hypothetical protein
MKSRGYPRGHPQFLQVEKGDGVKDVAHTRASVDEIQGNKGVGIERQ